jgi:hypothetical protein
MIRMERDNIAKIVGLLVAAIIVVAAWIIQPVGLWGVVLVTIPITVIGTLLVMSFMTKLEDERFAHIRDISARNSFVSLLLILPWLGALIALGVLVLDAVGVCVIVWILSIAIWYLSGMYYYRK